MTGLENSLEGSELHTTLFQNSIPAESAMPRATLNAESIVLSDKFGNAYFVRDAEVCLSRELQHSYHEETDAPTEGYFEKAYINHGGVCSDKSYEYMVVIAPTKTDIDLYEEKRPYDVLRADSQAHIVKDHESGITACAAFEAVSVDENILSLSPSVLMYRLEDGEMELSVSNPDLALYTGESDEIFDENGKRKERSVYGRSWVANPAHPTAVEIVLNGVWDICGNSADNVQIRVENNTTIINFTCFECQAAELKMARR